MAEQEQISQKVREADFLVARLGLPVVMCLFLCYLLFYKLGKIEDKLAWKLDRTIRNERAIMQKLGIPVILDGEQKE